jgi:hypothetical protein
VLEPTLGKVEAETGNRQENRENHRHHHEAATITKLWIVSIESEANDAKHDESAEVTRESKECSHSLLRLFVRQAPHRMLMTALADMGALSYASDHGNVT